MTRPELHVMDDGDWYLRFECLEIGGVDRQADECGILVTLVSHYLEEGRVWYRVVNERLGADASSCEVNFMPGAGRYRCGWVHEHADVPHVPLNEKSFLEGWRVTELTVTSVVPECTQVV